MGKLSSSFSTAFFILVILVICGSCGWSVMISTLPNGIFPIEENLEDTACQATPTLTAGGTVYRMNVEFYNRVTGRSSDIYFGPNDHHAIEVRSGFVKDHPYEFRGIESKMFKSNDGFTSNAVVSVFDIRVTDLGGGHYGFKKCEVLR